MDIKDGRDIIQDGVGSLIQWYRANKKDFPWRSDPSPYRVWISEIMLQQTRIEAAKPYFERFMREIPDIQSLAAVPDDKLMKLWEGLGYYSRARNLKKAAQKLVADYGGVLPAEAAELEKLPGIGAYTAGAISSIAYQRSAPAVDGNVLRVISRLLLSEEDVLLPAARKKTQTLLSSVYPSEEDAALFTQAIMELGERICLPNGKPLCALCPLGALCLAKEAGRAEELPVRRAKAERRQEQKTVLLLRSGGKYALRRREKSGLLAGLWEFPTFDGKLTEEEVASALAELHVEAENIAPCGEAVHVFTHLEWHMTGYFAECGETDAFLFKSPAEIGGEYALPSAFRFFKKKMETMSR